MDQLQPICPQRAAQNAVISSLYLKKMFLLYKLSLTAEHCRAMHFQVTQSIFREFEIIILSTAVSNAITMIHFWRFKFTISLQDQH